MKFIVIILGFAGWIYGMASFLYDIPPLSHNPIMTTITQNGWLLIGFGLLAFSVIIMWLGKEWRTPGYNPSHRSGPNPEAVNSTYPSKKK